MIHLSNATLITFALLTSSFIAVWFPKWQRKNISLQPWAILWLTSAISALYFNILQWPGFIYLLLIAGCCQLAKQPYAHRYLKILTISAAILLVIPLFLHAIPYFHNPLIFSEYLSGPNSATYSKYWNFDKASAGLILIAYFGDIIRNKPDLLKTFFSWYPIAIFTVCYTITAALLVGYIKPELSFSFAFIAWTWSNLFFTCIAEEMLFRGFLQKHLVSLFKKEILQLVMILVAGGLFGLAHIAGGPIHVVLASIAGVGYGYAYYKTGKIEAAIMTHFSLNAIHFLFFTYPHTSY